MTTRRSFFKGIAACGGGIALQGALPTITFANSVCNSNRKVVVSIFLSGGPHGPSILVPTGSGSGGYLQRHTTLGIRNALSLDSDHGLNPVMTNLQALYQQGKLAIMNGASYPGHSTSHADATDFFGRAVSTAVGGQYANTGWMGRFTNTYCSTSDSMALVSLSGLTEAVRAPGSNPTVLTSPLSGFNLVDYYGQSYSDFYSDSLLRARSNSGLNSPAYLLMHSAQAQVEDQREIIQQAVSNYSSQVQYPTNNSLANKLKDVARLLYSPLVNPKHILLTHPGFDTHADQNTRMPALLTELDRALAAFWQDMSAAGRANDVLIQAYGEFGRTHENTSAGTDHGQGGIFLLLGNNIRGGVHSPRYVDSDFLNNFSVPGKFDFREPLEQIIAHHFDLDPAPVFPEQIERIGMNLFV